MKRCFFASIAVVLLASGNLEAGQGDAVFEAQKCGICHKVETGQTTPSLREVAQAYQGKEDQLMLYLKGEVEPIIKPEKASMMKRPLEKTKALSDEDRKALADFILSHAK
ncbi:MAG: c-type cytochrome [Desulfobacterales bacterium]|nr:c-type cytochrome [Desulfobacterales bacterium]